MMQQLAEQTKVLLFESRYITVGILPEHESVFHVVHEAVPVDVMKEALIIGANALKEHGLSKWLSDDRNNGMIPEEVFIWGAEEWQPTTISYGWKYWANIVPIDVVTAGAMIPVMENLFALGLRMMVFTEEAAALEWLDSVE